MKKYIVQFKSGNRIKINQNIVDKLVERINSEEGALPWQSFEITDMEEVHNLIFNFSQVDCIYTIEEAF